MEAFFRTFEQMVADRPRKGFIRRSLMDEIGDDEKLVCIRGERGVGKTRFLLDFSEEKCRGKVCLYASLNYFYFSVHTLYSFASDFVHRYKGEVLLLDQIYKYPEWSGELSKIHRDFPLLRIIFTTSSVMTLSSDLEALKGEVAVYRLAGFSFREYINLRTGLNLGALTLQELLSSAKSCAAIIRQEVQPQDFLSPYLYGGGYYPPTAGAYTKSGGSLSDEELIKHLNMLLEVDVVYIRQIGPGYLPKLRQLLYILAEDADSPKPNISKLSDQLGISRATVMNYLRYLSDAGLIKLLFKGSDATNSKKADAVYLGNPNILSALTLESPEEGTMKATFLLSHLSGTGIEVSVPPVSGHTTHAFRTDDGATLHIEEPDLRKQESPGNYLIVDRLTQGRDQEIPLWLFGFLY